MNSRDYLSLPQIAAEYPGAAKYHTLRSWYLRDSYGFRALVTKVGSSLRIRRDRWEQWLEAGRTK